MPERASKPASAGFSESMRDILGSRGLLAGDIAGFAPRAAQQDMAEEVARALEHGGLLVTEAGTGTGKTYAYLVPALLCGKKVVISTGTKNLQDQIFHRDIPAVRAALGVPVTVALLKGRSNYLCHYRLERAPLAMPHAGHLQRIREWARSTRRGDIAELADVPEDSPVWPLATSTADNCLGQECPSFADCFLTQARRDAQQADVLVINHHLLFADVALRGEGFGELLPMADAYVLDEAHQLPQAAANFFGMSLSSRQLNELCNDAVIEQTRDAGDMPHIARAAQRVERSVRELRLALGADARRGAWSEVSGNAPVRNALDDVLEELDAMRALLEPAAVRGKGLESCWQRSQSMHERLRCVTGAVADHDVQWFETYTRSFTLNRTPLEIADAFSAHVHEHGKSWIFTSATLSVDGRFDHFLERMGIPEARTCRWDSPFDYPNQALLYLPKGLPDPNAPQYARAVVDAALPVLHASAGRAFMLFTSHRALRAAYDVLRGCDDFEWLVQGTMPRTQLLEQFRVTPRAVLLGTSSFWEGVDVRGEALSCVIIDKLPFAAPDDPLLRARHEALRRQGRNPFMDDQLPHAVILLKQGVGRLIRDAADRGVMMLCDPRVLAKPYGRIFLNSLPPMTRTREAADVEAFFRARVESA